MKYIEDVLHITKEELKIKETLVKMYKTLDSEMETLVRHFCENKRSWSQYINSFTGRLSLEDFVKIFILEDYVVERDREEVLLDYYRSLDEFDHECIIERQAVIQTLNILGKKVEGIN